MGGQAEATDVVLEAIVPVVPCIRSPSHVLTMLTMLCKDPLPPDKLHSFETLGGAVGPLRVATPPTASSLLRGVRQSGAEVSNGIAR